MVKSELMPTQTSSYIRKSPSFFSSHHRESLFTQVLQRLVHIAFLERSSQAHPKLITEFEVGELLKLLRKQ